MAALAARLLRTERRIATRQQRKPEIVYSSPTHFAREKLGFIPDPWQHDVLESEAKRLLLLCARQSGKSVTVAALALHTALSVDGSLILLLSRSMRQSGELFRKVKDFVNLLPIRPKLEEDNLLSVRFANGSRVVSLPGNEETVRGFSGAQLIIIDEASRVPDSLYYSIRPMLAVSDGRLICLTTPWGKRGFFHREWIEGTGWERVLITAHDCPRIPAAFLAKEKEDMPETWFKSEYLCQFSDASDQVFSHEHVMNAVSGEVDPLFDIAPLSSFEALDGGISPLGGGQ